VSAPAVLNAEEDAVGIADGCAVGLRPRVGEESVEWALPVPDSGCCCCCGGRSILDAGASTFRCDHGVEVRLGLTAPRPPPPPPPFVGFTTSSVVGR
jgi:hypothetical protein